MQRASCIHFMVSYLQHYFLHSADLRAMLSAGQNSSELLLKLANGWQPYPEGGSGGQQQLLSSPMVAPTSAPGTVLPSVCMYLCVYMAARLSFIT